MYRYLNNNRKVRTFVRVTNLLSMYSKPVIFIPLDADGKPTVEKGKYWYVRYWYRNPVTGKLQEFREKKGINRIKSITERKKAARNLQKAILNLLQNGFDPFKSFEEIKTKKTLTITQALIDAFENKSKIWAESTLNINTGLFKRFITWVKKNYKEIPVNQFSRSDISKYLNNLNLSSISRNNHLRLISSLVGQMASDDVIPYNYAREIPKLKEKPLKNKPFSKEQLKTIKLYLEKNNPYLLKYLQFITYAFLRPIEVNRICIGDIDLKNKVIYLKTKTNTKASIRIIDTLVDIINTMDIDKYDDDCSLFSNQMKPLIWVTKHEKSKYDWFSNQFLKAKKDLHLNNLYGLYSFRHTFAIDLYNKFINDGLTDLEAKQKLMTITRHRSLSGLTNYLRDIETYIPDDYSSDFTLDF